MLFLATFFFVVIHFLLSFIHQLSTCPARDDPNLVLCFELNIHTSASFEGGSLSQLASLVHISHAWGGGRAGLHYPSCVQASLASRARGWDTHFPGLGSRWVVEHPLALTLPFRAGRLGTDQRKDGEQPLGREETLKEAI